MEVFAFGFVAAALRMKLHGTTHQLQDGLSRIVAALSISSQRLTMLHLLFLGSRKSRWVGK